MNTATTDILAGGHYHPLHAARHRRPGGRSWLRRTAIITAAVFAAVTFLFGLIGWAAVLTVVF